MTIIRYEVVEPWGEGEIKAESPEGLKEALKRFFNDELDLYGGSDTADEDIDAEAENLANAVFTGEVKSVDDMMRVVSFDAEYYFTKFEVVRL